MKTLVKALTLSLAFLASSALHAQHPPAFPGVEKLKFMEGKWQGPSWSQTREGRVDSVVTEKVSCKWDCEIMLVEGKGVKGEGDDAVTVHSAFGVIRFDPASGQFVMQAYSKGRGMIDAPLTMTGDKSFQWIFEIPNNGGTVRYSVDFSEDGKWKEIGEYSRDGENWFKTLEMNLTKL